MGTRLELPEDLLEKIQLRASKEGRKLDETVTDLLRQALAGAAGIPVVDSATIESRREIADKFITGEWGAELSAFETARAADRECASKRGRAWRD